MEIRKEIRFEAAHVLSDYNGLCGNLHGHSYTGCITIYDKVQEDGMVMDFTHIKKSIQDRFDHKVINEVVDFNPTAENLARYICDSLSPWCFRVDVQESIDNIASYIKD